MGIFKGFKRIFFKENFEFSSPDVDLDNFHPQLRRLIVPLGIFFNNQDSFLRFLNPVLNSLMIFIAVVMEMICVIHGIQTLDYSFFTECFCYLVMLLYVPVLYFSVLGNKDSMLEILHQMEGDFKFICNLGDKHRDHFLKRQLLIWQFFLIWMATITSVAFLIFLRTLIPLTYQSLIATHDEHTIRPSLFPMWLPKDDPYRTPNYEIFMFFQMYFVCVYVQSFGVNVYIQFHMLIHNYTILELVIIDFEMIFEDLDEDVVYLSRYHPRRVLIQRILNKRIQRIVAWHDSVFTSFDNLSSIQGPVICYQVLFTPIVYCLMMFQIADKLEGGQLDIYFAGLLSVFTFQLWMPCYIGSLLRNKGFDVGEACYNSSWNATPLSRMIRNDIVIVMSRAQQPLSMQFFCLPDLSLETFSSIMSSAYSYFNMIRQSNN
ncbi:hypothetical protein ABMA27_000523 [Loxostege sticticalis]|uniref:Odorant receptor n=1 Tax=Loxostege sticticalis TaxID=481309 RepID=A0ABR3INQ8_LOXSC